MSDGQKNALSGVGLVLMLFGAVAIARELASVLMPEEHPLTYTCREVLGPEPRPGFIAIFPPGWKVDVFSFQVWDADGKLVCDEKGLPVK